MGSALFADAFLRLKDYLVLSIRFEFIYAAMSLRVLVM